MTAVTTTTDDPAGGGTDGPADRGAARARRRRRWGWPLAVVGAVVLTALIMTAMLPESTRGALDPRAADPQGSRALAEILRAQGVTVDLVQRSDAAVDGAGPDSTILVTHPELLGPLQFRRLSDTEADLVLVEPNLVVLDELAGSVTPAGVSDDSPAVEPACADADATAAGAVTGGGQFYAPFPAAGNGSGNSPGTDPAGTDPAGTDPAGTDPAGAVVLACYPDPDRAGRYSVVRVEDGERRVTVLGQRQVLQNGHLASEGNAALALRTLGAHPQLRWYLPDPAEPLTDDSDDGGPAIGSLLPPWVRWVFWQLVITTLVLLLWRGRRLGPVVPEPLPVVVRSAETVEGRARLYRSARARGRAAAILRTTAVRRLATRLGVPAQADPRDVAHLAAQASGTDPARTHQVLLGDPPRDDAALVALAGALDDLEHAVAGTAVGRPRYGDPAKDHRRHDDGPNPEGGR